MVRTHTPPQNIEVTLLALGKGYGLYGDRSGNVGRICECCIEDLTILDPKRVYVEKATPELISGFPFVVSEDIPRDRLISFGRVIDPATRLGVYAAFDSASKVWYVREVLDQKTKEGSGRFFFEGPEILFDDLETVC